ncbi:MAG: translocation/assembly module TamB domain-containing protein [Desulfobaccales bacterium]
MRWLKMAALGVGLLTVLVAAGLGLALRSEAIWTWGGQRLVALAQERLYPSLSVAEVKGHPLTGLTFTGIRLTAPEGEVLRAERLELTFSLWSFVRLRPILSRVAVYQPQVQLWWAPDGQVNLSRVLKPRPPPPFRSLDFPEVVVSGGEVTVRRDGRLQRYGPVDLEAAVSILHPKQPQQKVLVRRVSLAWTGPPGRLKLSGRLTLRPEELQLLELALRLDETLLLKGSGQGWSGEAPGVRLAMEMGPLAGETLARFWPQWPAAWPLAGRVQVEGGLSGGSFTAELTLAGSPLALQGRLLREPGTWAYALDLAAPALPVEWLGPWRPEWVARASDLPPLNLRLVGKGAGFTWPPERLDWELTLGAVAWRGVKVEAARGTLTGNSREQALTMSGRGSFGRLAATLKGPLLTAWRGDVDLEAQDLLPGLLGLATPPDTRMSGRFRGTFHLPEMDARRLTLAGDLRGSGRWGNLPVQELKARLAWAAPRLEVREAALTAAGLTATGQGRVSPQELEAKVQGRLRGPVSWLPGPRFSQAAFDLALSGSVSQPRAVLTAQVQGLTGGGLAARSLNVAGTLSGWPPAAGQLTLTATGLTTPVAPFPRAQMLLRGENHRWHLEGTASGEGKNRVELAGLLETGGRPVLFTLSRFAFSLGQLTGRAQDPVRLAVLPGVRLEPAVFLLNGGRLEAEGRFTEGAVTARVDARDLPAGLVGFKGVPLKGKIQLKAGLGGTPARPTLTAVASLSEGGWGKLEVKQARASLSYGDGTLSLSGTLEEARRGSRLSLEGRLPWRLSLTPWAVGRGEGDLRVTLSGEKFNLAVLPALTREVTEADLPLEFQALWEGPAARPRVRGNVRWAEGYVNFRLGGARYQVSPGSAQLEGSTLTVPELLLTSDGTARIRGTLALEGFWPGQVNLRGELINFKALSRLGSEARGEGSLTVTGPFEALLVAGRLTVTQAVFRPLFFETGISEDIVLVRQPKVPENGRPQAPAFIRNARMDITLDAPKNIWVRDKRANLELGGRLLAFKEPEGPVRVRGEMRVLTGTVEVHGKPFVVKEGIIHLPGRPPELITVKGRAEHQMEEVLLILEMTGPLAKPEIRLASLPPLPPADLLSYMAFGQRAATLTREQYSSVGAQAVGLIGGLTTKKLLDFLGKDFPLLGDLYFTGGPERVGVGKPITRDLRLSFERVTDPLTRSAAENQVRLEYRLGRRVSVESQVGRRTSGVDVFWNFDF